MANNLKEIKTTIIGSILFIIGIAITLIEYFTVDTVEWQHYVFPIAFLIAGIGFLVAPDRILNFAFKWGAKKVGQ